MAWLMLLKRRDGLSVISRSLTRSTREQSRMEKAGSEWPAGTVLVGGISPGDRPALMPSLDHCWSCSVCGDAGFTTQVIHMKDHVLPTYVYSLKSLHIYFKKSLILLRNHIKGMI